jgi:hypothetical protein
MMAGLLSENMQVAVVVPVKLAEMHLLLRLAMAEQVSIQQLKSVVQLTAVVVAAEHGQLQQQQQVVAVAVVQVERKI